MTNKEMNKGLLTNRRGNGVLENEIELVNVLNREGRGTQVAVEVTEKNELDAFTGMSQAMAMAKIKKTLRNTLYAWAPVYRVVTVIGLDTKGELLTENRLTIGGNTPVARELVAKDDSVSCDKDVVTFDDLGEKHIHRIHIGAPKDSKAIRYDYSKEIVLVLFDKDLARNLKNSDADYTEEEFVKMIIGKGLTITADNKVVIGKTDNDDDQFISPLVWTPSNERSGQILFSSFKHYDVWKALEKIGGHSFTALFEKGEMPMAKFKKLASRLGLFASPAVEFTKVGGKTNFGLAVIDRALLGNPDYSEEAQELLNLINVTIESNQWDGSAYVSSAFMVEGLRNLGMKGINIVNAELFAAQLRVQQFYGKVFAEAVHQSVMNRILNVVLPKLKALEEKMRANGDLEDGQYLYRIYGNKDNIGMLLDGDAAKIIDLGREADNIQVYLLDIAKASESATSTQMLDKFALFDKEATFKFLEEKAEKEILEYAGSIGDKNNSLLYSNIDVYKTLLNAGKSAGAGTQLFNNVFSDRDLVLKLLKDTSTKHMSMVWKARIKINSTFQRALFDISYILTGEKVRILGIDDRGAVECFSRDVLVKFKDEIEAIESDNTLSENEKDAKLRKLLTSAVIKYPTPGSEEIELVVFLTERQLKRRILKLVDDEVIDQATARVLFRYYSFTSYGVIKIAADNTVKHKLAGMDTDYDGVLVIHEKALVDILIKVYEKRVAEFEKEYSVKLTNGHAGVIPFIISSKKLRGVFDKDKQFNKAAAKLKIKQLIENTISNK